MASSSLSSGHLESHTLLLTIASSSSRSSRTISRHGTIKKLKDAVYEHYRPVTRSIDLEIIFFHGFQSQDCQNPYVETWMPADESACWLNSWLSEKFPQSHMLSISYDSSTVVTDSTGRMDMYLVGEHLAKSIIELAGVGQTCPVVLVGHCVGGLVLKEVCCRAEKLATKLKAQGYGLNSYSSFLSNMKGAFRILQASWDLSSSRHRKMEVLCSSTTNS